MELSIIFPAFNEAKRIGPTLTAFHDFLKNKGISYELLVVDDGSTDQTVTFLRSLQPEMPQLRIIELLENSGKGQAVKTGMLEAHGQVRLFSDADGSTPPEEMTKLLEPISRGEAEIAIGSRYLPGSEIFKAQPFARQVWSRLANGVVQSVLLPGLADPHCGFKAFQAEAAIRIFSACTIQEWAFDLEVLALARNSGFRIVEIPVKWTNDERSKGRIRQVPKEIYNLYKIRQRLPKQ